MCSAQRRIGYRCGPEVQVADAIADCARVSVDRRWREVRGQTRQRRPEKALERLLLPVEKARDGHIRPVKALERLLLPVERDAARSVQREQHEPSDDAKGLEEVILVKVKEPLGHVPKGVPVRVLGERRFVRRRVRRACVCEKV